MLTQNIRRGYDEILSKTISVTPERHSGIFMPTVRLDHSATPLWRDDTARYKTLTGNMQGGSDRPRVNPATQHPHRCVAIAQKLSGVAIMATQAQNSPAYRLSNLDALDVASARIAQEIAFLDVLMLASSSNDTIVSRDTVTNSIWGVRQLLEQASAAVEEV